MYPFVAGFVVALLVLSSLIPSSAEVCRAAYHAPEDQTITWKDGACVRVITTVQSLEAPKP